MVYGALVIPRTRYASKVKSIDDSEARKIPGFVKAVKIDDSMGKCTGWVVALAEKFPAAMKAAKALKVEVDPGPYGGLNLKDLFAEYAQTTKNTEAGANWVLEGDVDKALAGAEKVLEMEYTTDMVCHATMEPLNATARVRRRRVARLQRNAKHVVRAHDANGLPVESAQPEAGGSQDLRA